MKNRTFVVLIKSYKESRVLLFLDDKAQCRQNKNSITKMNIN